MLKYKKASTDWFAGSSGMSVHWTPAAKPLQGTPKKFQDAVRKFDMDSFINQIADTGSRHLVFTITHASQHLACPHPVLDYLLPGRTCKRDLLGELCEGLRRKDIKLIFYYNHSCNGDGDDAWQKAVGYADTPLDLFAGRIMSIVEYLSRRYGKLISGWWFDSSYSLDPRGLFNSVSTEMGDWRFPWEALTAAAKSGNPESIVTYNSGVDFNYLYTGHQDFWAGETTSLQYIPHGRWVNGLQLHQWLCIDKCWLHNKINTPLSNPIYSDNDLFDFASRIVKSEGAVTFNVEISQEGGMNFASLKQIQTINRRLKS